MRIKNVRGHTLEIADTGDRVEPDGEIEVSDEIGTSLCEQPANWVAAATPKAASSGKNKED